MRKPDSCSLQVLRWIGQFDTAEQAMLAALAFCPFPVEKRNKFVLIGYDDRWKIVLDGTDVDYDDEDLCNTVIRYERLREVLDAYDH